MEAFDTLVRVFQRPMFNLAYRMVNNREDATDLTQEIFVKMYRSVGKFRGASKFSTWLYSLATNTCRSGLRRLRRISDREVMRLDAEEETEQGVRKYDPADTGDLPDRRIERKETLRLIQEAIAGLADDFRTVLVLRDMQGLTYDDIAVTLGCSIGTVKSRLSRARIKVKDKLIREGLTCAVRK